MRLSNSLCATGTWKMAMPRRKITRDQDEIEYRLLDVTRRKESGIQLVSRLAAVAALAHMWKVDTGTTFESLLAYAQNTIKSRAGIKPAPEDLPAPTTGEEKEPLTTPSPTGIFDDSEDDNE